MKSINSGLIDYKEQSDIIRTVASNMIQHEKTNKDQVTEVAVALVQKIPSLKGVFGIEYVRIYFYTLYYVLTVSLSNNKQD